MIYQSLLQGNQLFGTTPADICRHVLKCEPQQIHERVILAPWWQPELFLPLGAKLNSLSKGGHIQVWNLEFNELEITYIRTGIGATVVAETVLALGCTPSLKNKSLYSGRTAAEMEYRHEVRANTLPRIVLAALQN